MTINEHKNKSIIGSKDAANVISSILATEDEISRNQEHFYVISLNSRNIIKNIELIGLSTVDSVTITAREVFRRAIIEGASNIIVAHNHPNGNTSPSGADIEVTKTLVEAGALLGVPLVDHIIVTDNNHSSMCDLGLI